jgi:hypothetical protein
MDEFERKKRKVLAPIFFEAGAALFDCQSFEHGIAYFLYLMPRLGVVGLYPAKCTAIMDHEEKRTAGQLMGLLKSHVRVSDGIEQGLVAALQARNKLVHRYLVDNAERFVDLREHDKIVREIRTLRSTIRKGHARLQPFVEHLAQKLDGIDVTALGAEAKQKFLRDTKEH